MKKILFFLAMSALLSADWIKVACIQGHQFLIVNGPHGTAVTQIYFSDKYGSNPAKPVKCDPAGFYIMKEGKLNKPSTT
jgi:hypothetical protein